MIDFIALLVIGTTDIIASEVNMWPLMVSCAGSMISVVMTANFVIWGEDPVWIFAGILTTIINGVAFCYNGAIQSYKE